MTAIRDEPPDDRHQESDFRQTHIAARLDAIERELAEYSLGGTPRWVAHAPVAGGVVLVGNPAALLTLAARLVQAARLPAETQVDEPWVVPQSEITAETTEERLFRALRWDEWRDEPTVATNPSHPKWRDRVALFGCALVGFVLMFLLVSGILFWSKLLADR